MATFRKFSRRLFLLLNGVVGLLFLLACAAVVLHPGDWWPLSLLGFIFPLLLVLLTGFFVACLFFRSCRRWSLLSLAILIIGWPNTHAFFAFHPGAGFDQHKPPHSIRVLTWNLRSFDDFITRKPGESSHRTPMLNFIAGTDADILCLQEFFEPHNQAAGLPPNISYFQQQLHYPYYYFSRDFRKSDGSLEAGSMIFSRYPITDSLSLNFMRPEGLRTTESLIAIDINVEGTPVRIFTTHLQSVLFRHKDFHDLEIIRKVEDSILPASKSIVKKLRNAYRSRGDQALRVREQLDNCPNPGIICGDFNDIPNSYTYFTIRDRWKDAFIEKGFGIGRTYVHISPTLRIDYILADPRLKVLQCRKFSLPWSDHNPVLADLQVQPAR